MSEKAGESLAQTQHIFEAMSGRKQHTTTDIREVIASLRAGQGPVSVELPWNETRDGQLIARHQVVLTRADEERIYFINPLHTNRPVGTALGGQQGGPARCVEADGESMSLANFLNLFSQGGIALLPNP